MWDTAAAEETVRGRTFAAAFVLLFIATILQVSVVARLPLPVGRIDLVLFLVAAIALIEGPLLGALLGFSIGLLGDLLSTHVLGQAALVLCLVGYGAGLVTAAAHQSVTVPLVTISGATFLGTLGYAASTSILGNAALTGGQAVVRALASGGYSLLLTSFLYPLLLLGSRRLAGDRRRGLR
jgi:rod shape-determining protein MreD